MALGRSIASTIQSQEISGIAGRRLQDLTEPCAKNNAAIRAYDRVLKGHVRQHCFARKHKLQISVSEGVLNNRMEDNSL
jgi:hypothetical protein